MRRGETRLQAVTLRWSSGVDGWMDGSPFAPHSSRNAPCSVRPMLLEHHTVDLTAHPLREVPGEGRVLGGALS